MSRRAASKAEARDWCTRMAIAWFESSRPQKQTCRPEHVSVRSEGLLSTSNSSDYEQNAGELFEGGF
jgi:hypothetical protein